MRRLRSRRSRGMELEPARRPRSRESRAGRPRGAISSADFKEAIFFSFGPSPGTRAVPTEQNFVSSAFPEVDRGVASRGMDARSEFRRSSLLGAPGAVLRKQSVVRAPRRGLRRALGRGPGAETPAPRAEVLPNRPILRQKRVFCLSRSPGLLADAHSFRATQGRGADPNPRNPRRLLGRVQP